MKRSGSGVHVFELAFEDTEGILNSRLFDILIDVHFDSHNCTIAYSGHCRFGGDLTKPAITTASVERFYSDLVICLQLDIALLFQKSVKS